MSHGALAPTSSPLLPPHSTARIGMNPFPEGSRARQPPADNGMSKPPRVRRAYLSPATGSGGPRHAEVDREWNGAPGSF